MTRPLPAALGIAAALALPAGDLRADADEASLDVHAVGGLAVLTDAAAERAARAPIVGLAARASYATRDTWQYELGVVVATTTAARYDHGHFEPAGRPPVDGAFTLRQQLARADLGVTVRLGVRYIPRLRAFVGPQLRRVAPATLAGATVRDATLGVDLVGGASLGLDLRLGRRLVIGADAAATYALPLAGDPLRTFELDLHLAYYWYPR